MKNNSQERLSEKFKQLHGFNGLLHMQDSYNRIYDIMSGVIDAVKNFGIPYSEDFNGERQNGFTNQERRRCSLAEGYLKDALKKVELHSGSGPYKFGKIVVIDIKSYAHVLDIIWDDENKKENIAISVRYFCNGTVHEAFIAPKGEIILCGEAINSPQILMLSCIGPKENLKANNIKVCKELPVGKNLSDHQSCLFSAKANPNIIHHWSSRPEIGILYKANSTNGDEISNEDWEKFVVKRTTTAFHPYGTVKMAPEFKNGVVNYRLQVYSMKNLRVVDVSIFPYIPSRNTNVPTAMVSWRASQLIIEDYTKKIE
ncbi:23485_t:CDS:2 [Cetraspora pellucida]|uniref:23485_t:CDS:1 n=1 Tax=Cetraspora pellucida TaxID=1433469 RepID=A0A9N9FSA2_9GLOM|nr:23485_t:CDS:2 [Cetraspora pellucida]